MNRGGSWINSPRNCRVSYRNNWLNDRDNNLGFRLVLAPSSRECRIASTEQMMVLIRNGRKGDPCGRPKQWY